MNNNQIVARGVVTLLCAVFVQRADAGTDCGVSNQFAIDNVIGGIASDVSAAFTINNVIPDLMCDVSATFTINNLPAAIPTVSQWGSVAMALLLAGAGTITFRRRTRQPHAHAEG